MKQIFSQSLPDHRKIISKSVSQVYHLTLCKGLQVLQAPTRSVRDHGKEEHQRADYSKSTQANLT